MINHTRKASEQASQTGNFHDTSAKHIYLITTFMTILLNGDTFLLLVILNGNLSSKFAFVKLC